MDSSTSIFWRSRSSASLLIQRWHVVWLPAKKTSSLESQIIPKINNPVTLRNRAAELVCAVGDHRAGQRVRPDVQDAGRESGGSASDFSQYQRHGNSLVKFRAKLRGFS